MFQQRPRLRAAVHPFPDPPFVGREDPIDLARADRAHLGFDALRQREALARPRQPERQQRLQPRRPRIPRHGPDRLERPHGRRPIPARPAASTPPTPVDRLRPPPRPDQRLAVVAGHGHRFGQQPALLRPRLGPHIPVPHLRQILRLRLWPHAGALLWHTGFGNTIYGATILPSVTLSTARYEDYHFALLPRMIREMLPAATIITFWHIPWPNPEAFAICPFREELLDGMLGSSILGFHTQFHCNNFLDTVDRQLEARVDRETFTVSYRRASTTVKRYPISIEWPPDSDLVEKPVNQCRSDVRRRHGLPSDHAVAVGVDRFDYTKGIEERLRAVERLLEQSPEWVGRFTFIQIAAPTRASIEEYQHYDERVRSIVRRINDRFSDAPHAPVILLAVHHERAEVYEYYRASDVCVVTSLHDGMNLVAKEFVAARDDERGVLVLSQFTGAARELPEAIIVNPYDVDECAGALHTALTMPKEEQRARMRLMRSLVGEFNVFRWAGRMLIDAASMRNRSRLLGRIAAADGAGQSPSFR